MNKQSCKKQINVLKLVPGHNKNRRSVLKMNAGILGSEVIFRIISLQIKI